ncbi:DsrE/DsrF-like family protein [Xenococcus sp. PCC 7305]|uniref:DsrE family protein n=1 Tax=Xenococcus sp. PCC 7305 TaxID=102125 RepID=UPI0002AC8CF1|nr:DsrE family protein [Xenococcus sp. PCC 7305]ELS03581.1 DsrE/DsrF-like family protein [Xenococcus sp. PCC 7305]
MTHYLILESRDPYDSADWKKMQDIIVDLKKNGNDVTLFLIQNGVLPIRQGTSFESHFDNLKSLGINILADLFALQERGIKNTAQSVEKSSIDRLVELSLIPNTKTIWH